ncbi:hypothetical protein QUB70_13070 [Microcoleus sp. A003_D6]
MPTPQEFLWHRHLACANIWGGQDAHPTRIFVAQASCLCKYLGRARCPPHKNFCGTGILPVQRFGAGKMPTPQEFLWHRHLACDKDLGRARCPPHKNFRKS